MGMRPDAPYSFLSKILWTEQALGAVAFASLASTNEVAAVGLLAIAVTVPLHILANIRSSRPKAVPTQSAESLEIESYHNTDPIPSKELLELRRKQNSNVVTDWDPAIEGKRLMELESEFRRTVVEQNATYKSIYKSYKSNPIR